MSLGAIRFRMLLAAGLVILSVGLLVLWDSQTKVQAVKVSNGKFIQLGESRKDLHKSMGKTIKQVAPNVYRYPGNVKLPTQVVIYMNKDKVSAMLLTRSSANRQIKTGAAVGSTWQRIKKSLGVTASAKAIDAKADKIKQKGYKVAGLNANSYYITFSCNPKNGERLTAVAIAYKGRENLISPLLRNRDCTKAKTQTAQPQP